MACDGCSDPYCGDCAAREAIDARIQEKASFIPRELPKETKELVGVEFLERLEAATKRISMLSPRALKAMEEAEIACVCKHCGRCVLAGPPCCYDSLYEAYQLLHKENMWYRKVQSKKDKKINSLQQELNNLKESYQKLLDDSDFIEGL